jgi:hypothetical protein
MRATKWGRGLAEGLIDSIPWSSMYIPTYCHLLRPLAVLLVWGSWKWRRKALQHSVHHFKLRQPTLPGLAILLLYMMLTISATSVPSRVPTPAPTVRIEYLQTYFESMGTLISLPNVASFQLYDLNNDGLSDIVAGSASGSFGWYENFGGGSVSSMFVINSTLGDVQRVDIANVTETGNVNILGVGLLSVSNSVVLYLNSYFTRTASSFASSTLYVASNSITAVSPITNGVLGNAVIHDMDSDGNADVIFSYTLSGPSSGGGVAWIRNRASFTYDPLFTTALSSQRNAVSIRVGDLNNDGEKDIILATQTSIYVIKGLGNGNFAAESLLLSPGSVITDLHAVDLNKDGKLDLLVAVGKSSNLVAWYKNLGNFTFLEVVLTPYIAGPSALAVGDFDFDNILDVALAASQGLYFFKQYAGGAFSDPILLKLGTMNTVGVADIDGDGLNDIVVGQFKVGQLNWYRGTQSPTGQPTSQPSRQPTRQPTGQPTRQPTSQPTSKPSTQPTSQPSNPTGQPTSSPTCQPTTQPSVQPTSQPSSRPTRQPTTQPSSQPTRRPTAQPTRQPTGQPTGQPTRQPTGQPTRQPLSVPSSRPSAQPTRGPTAQPSAGPTGRPSGQPTRQPTAQPTRQPTRSPSGQPTRQPTAQPTRQPSAQPTRQPSAQPTRQPTRQPTSQPTRQPTVQPTAQPTRQPSAQPTRGPTGKPTEMPSSIPTMRPSTQPSGHPSGLPTVEPSVRPTIPPSSIPSGIPSAQPTRLPSPTPTGLPTMQPSAQPTTVPSSQPTIFPSSKPTGQPISSPSLQPIPYPTSQPSKQPTVQPTRQPSSQPSRQPTAQPTTQPTATPSTSHPTSTYKTMWRSRYESLLASLSSEANSSSVYSNNLQVDLPIVTYGELVVDGKYVFGGCDEWQDFLSNTLASMSAEWQVSSLEIVHLNRRNGTASSRTCSASVREPSYSGRKGFSDDIVVDLVGSSTPALPKEIYCDGYYWTIESVPLNYLSYSRSLCVDCHLQRTNCKDIYNNLGQLYFISPCQRWTCKNVSVDKASYIRFLRVQFKPFMQIPRVRSILIQSAQKTSVNISVSVTAAGFVRCAAFAPNYRPRNSLDFLTSDSMASSATSLPVLTHGNRSCTGVSHVPSNRVVNLVVSHLHPATSYDIICVTESIGGVESTIAVSEVKSPVYVRTKTLCCKPIILDVQSANIETSSSGRASNYLNAASVTLPYPPSTGSLSLTVFGYFWPESKAATAFSDPFTPKVQTPYQPSTIVVIAPHNSSYSPRTSSFPFQQSLSFLGGAQDGHHSLNVSWSGQAAAEFEVIYASPESAMLIRSVSSAAAVHTPSIVSAIFSDDGTYVSINFDVATNMAPTVAQVANYRFYCYKLFILPRSISGRSSILCTWGTDGKSVQMAATDASIVPNVMLHLRGGLVQAACVVSTLCSRLNYTLGLNFTIAGPINPRIPSVSVTAPSTIGYCNELLISFDASTNSLGKDWSNVTVFVYGLAGTPNIPIAESAIAIEGLLNLQYAASQSLLVPQNLLITNAAYVFTIRLCSFVGLCGFGRKTVSVVEYEVPTAIVHGNNFRVMPKCSSLSLTAYGDNGMCDGSLSFNRPSMLPSSQPTSLPTTQPSNQPSRQPSSQPVATPTAVPSTFWPSGQPTRSPSSQPTRVPTIFPTMQPSIQPSAQPTAQPTVQPSRQPSSQPTRQPTRQPTGQPTATPTTQPTRQPTGQPTRQPTRSPSRQPTAQPSRQPTRQPTAQPTRQPTSQPTRQPSRQPTSQPSRQPTVQPSSRPSNQPTSQPTSQPTMQPTMQPSMQPTSRPSSRPSAQPTALPSRLPTGQPTRQPTSTPSNRPTSQPSRKPTAQPSRQPTNRPTVQPTCQPTRQPTKCPTSQPSRQPTRQPTSQPTRSPTSQPSGQPTRKPTGQPSRQPSMQPTTQPTLQPTRQPTGQPTRQPTRQPTCQPTGQPSAQPISRPTSQPTRQPTRQPTAQPTRQPTRQPTAQPTRQPTAQPTGQPTMTPFLHPTSQPSGQPTGQPTRQPTSHPTSHPTPVRFAVMPTSQPTRQPTARPSVQPSQAPSVQPTLQPSCQPTSQPTGQPSRQPTSQPTMQPSRQPTAQPTRQPTAQPTRQPTSRPSMKPSVSPTMQPSGQPTRQPTGQPTRQPTTQPTGQPTRQPTSQPTRQPTAQPTAGPSKSPSMEPSAQPSGQPTAEPSGQPSAQPTGEPTTQPSTQPTGQPTRQPTAQPTRQPTSQPTAQPTRQPTSQPTRQPTSQPTMQPTQQPSAQPTRQPSTQPTNHPTMQPTCQPTGQPTSQPSGVPSGQPTRQPTGQPTRQPSAQPSRQPTRQPTSQPSGQPSRQPTRRPTGQPTLRPSMRPSSQPSTQPSSKPSIPTGQPTSKPTTKTPRPTSQPTAQPSRRPSNRPSAQPTGHPLRSPSGQPSSKPTAQPILTPTSYPSGQPSGRPSLDPSGQPTTQPTKMPSRQPTGQPSRQPTGQPSRQPTGQPSIRPTRRPTGQPTAKPSSQPILRPTSRPSSQPTAGPSMRPSSQPTSKPSAQPVLAPTSKPSSQPSSRPSRQPTTQPSSRPTAQPSSFPSIMPSSQPTAQPSLQPTARPSIQPTSQPTFYPTVQPTSVPSSQPTSQPSRQPTAQPTRRPSSQPTRQPTSQPTRQPNAFPTSRPSSQPSSKPTRTPSSQPSLQPTRQPSARPSGQPSTQPTMRPSAQPTRQPTAQPSRQPTSKPSKSHWPTSVPTAYPTFHFEELPISVYSSVQYSWLIESVSTNTTVVPFSKAITASSVNTDLTLAACALPSDAYYRVLFLTTNLVTNSQSSTEVKIYVQPGRLVAVISGSGSGLKISPGSILSLDGGSSNDEEGRTFSYRWQCVRVQPIYSQSNCGVIFTSETNASVATILAPTNIWQNTTVNISLTIWEDNIQALSKIYGHDVDYEAIDLYGRSSTAYVLVSVSPSDAPVLQLKVVKGGVFSNGVYTVNPSAPFRLLFTLSEISTSILPLTISWSMTPSVLPASLAAVTTSTTSLSLPASYTASSVLSTISLQRNSFTAGSTYTFTVTVTSSNPELSWSSLSTSVSVAMNKGPVAGLFTVLPSSGMELKTMFIFSASAWTSTNLPLSYQFLYQSADGTLLSLSATTESSSLQSYLTYVGNNGKIVTCWLRVYDSLATYTSASVAVSVSRNSSVIVTLLSLLRANTTATSVNVMKNTLSVGLGIINSVNCSAAPNCTRLHRSSCLAVANTCGPCLSGYSGQVGQQNTACYSTTANSAVTRIPDSSTFLSNLQCSTDSECLFEGVSNCNISTRSCYFQSQSCANNCSSHGMCVLVSLLSLDVVSTCLVGDVSCEARCVCHYGWYGSQCAYTQHKYQLLSATRSAMVNRLMEVVKVESELSFSSSAALQVVQYWVDTMVQLTMSADQLVSSVSATKEHLATILTLISNYSHFSGLSSDTLSSVKTSVSVYLKLATYYPVTVNIQDHDDAVTSITSLRRQLASYTGTNQLSSEDLTRIVGIVSSFAVNGYAAQMQSGEAAVEIVDNYYAFSLYAPTVTDLTATVSGSHYYTVTSPASEFEFYSGYVPSKFVFPINASAILNDETVVIGVCVLKNVLYRNDSYNSDVFLALSATTSSQSGPSSVYAVDLYNTFSGAIPTKNLDFDDATEVVDIQCTSDTPVGTVITHVCADGEEVSVNCSSRVPGTYTIACSFYKQLSQCNALEGLYVAALDNYSSYTSIRGDDDDDMQTFTIASNQECVLDAVDPFHTRCSCVLPAQANANAALSTSAANEYVSAVSSALVARKYLYHVPVEITYASYSPEWVFVKDYTIIGTVSALSGIFAALACLFVAHDRLQSRAAITKGVKHTPGQRKIVSKSETQLQAGSRSTNRVTPSSIPYSRQALKGHVMDQCVPHSYCTNLYTFLQRIWYECMHNHPFLQLLVVCEYYIRPYCSKRQAAYRRQQGAESKYQGLSIDSDDMNDADGACAVQRSPYLILLELLVHVVTCLCFLLVLYTHLDPDDGTCELEYRSEQACLGPRAALTAGTQSRCTWDSQEQLCHMRLPTTNTNPHSAMNPQLSNSHNHRTNSATSLIVLIQYAIVCSLIAAPLTRLATYIIKHVLATPPLPVMHLRSQSEHEHAASRRGTKLADKDVRSRIGVSATISRKKAKALAMLDMAVAGSVPSGALPAEIHHNKMMTALCEYLNDVDVGERRMLVNEWGLSVLGTRSAATKLAVQNNDVVEALRKLYQRSSERLVELRRLFQFVHVTNERKEIELLQAFIVDMMLFEHSSRLPATLLQFKWQFDKSQVAYIANKHVELAGQAERPIVGNANQAASVHAVLTASPTGIKNSLIRDLCWCYFVSLYVCMIFVIMYTLYNNPLSRRQQKLWLRSFFCWLFIDFVCTPCLAAYLLHYFLPACTGSFSGVNTIKDKIMCLLASNNDGINGVPMPRPQTALEAQIAAAERTRIYQIEGSSLSSLSASASASLSTSANVLLPSQIVASHRRPAHIQSRTSLRGDAHDDAVISDISNDELDDTDDRDGEENIDADDELDMEDGHHCDTKGRIDAARNDQEYWYERSNAIPDKLEADSVRPPELTVPMHDLVPDAHEHTPEKEPTVDRWRSAQYFFPSYHLSAVYNHLFSSKLVVYFLHTQMTLQQHPDAAASPHKDNLSCEKPPQVVVDIVNRVRGEQPQPQAYPSAWLITLKRTLRIICAPWSTLCEQALIYVLLSMPEFVILTWAHVLAILLLGYSAAVLVALYGLSPLYAVVPVVCVFGGSYLFMYSTAHASRNKVGVDDTSTDESNSQECSTSVGVRKLNRSVRVHVDSQRAGGAGRESKQPKYLYEGIVVSKQQFHESQDQLKKLSKRERKSQRKSERKLRKEQLLERNGDDNDNAADDAYRHSYELEIPGSTSYYLHKSASELDANADVTGDNNDDDDDSDPTFHHSHEGSDGASSFDHYGFIMYHDDDNDHAPHGENESLEHVHSRISHRRQHQQEVGLDSQQEDSSPEYLPANPFKRDYFNASMDSLDSLQSHEIHMLDLNSEDPGDSLHQEPGLGHQSILSSSLSSSYFQFNQDPLDTNSEGADEETSNRIYNSGDDADAFNLPFFVNSVQDITEEDNVASHRSFHPHDSVHDEDCVSNTLNDTEYTQNQKFIARQVELMQERDRAFSDGFMNSDGTPEDVDVDD